MASSVTSEYSKMTTSKVGSQKKVSVEIERMDRLAINQ